MVSGSWEASQARGFELRQLTLGIKRRKVVPETPMRERRKAETDSQVLVMSDGGSGLLPGACWQKKDRVLSLQYERQLGLFSFFLFLALAFESYFILYTLPECQTQAEVSEPDVTCALRELPSETSEQLSTVSADSAVMGQIQGVMGIQGRKSCFNIRKESRKASQDDMEELQERSRRVVE